MKTTLSDFTFRFASYGHYEVIYMSPITSKEWSMVTSDMTLIDAVKNSDVPKLKDLNQLKKLCKS